MGKIMVYSLLYEIIWKGPRLPIFYRELSLGLPLDTPYVLHFGG